MYSAPFYHVPFQPDPSAMHHAREREAYEKRLRAESFPVPTEPSGLPLPAEPVEESAPQSLSRLLEMVSPEDSALIALVLFLLCDNSENDVVLLGILLYVLLSK